MISKDTITLVRDRTDIVAVVSESVPSIKKRGRRFVGLCPFHKEKTPSFHVNPDTGLYHCFGCKESGDAFTFLERIEGYTFTEAVQALAERAGIPIEMDEAARGAYGEAERHKRDREALYGAMQMAAVWYETQLREHPDRAPAIEELARRGLAPDVDAVQAFRIGYAPSGWDGLASYLRAQGCSPAVSESVGLLVPRVGGSGYYDRFRHRLMFAVIDVQGRVVAFSGRALPPLPVPQNDAGRVPPPKYINSPESAIYVKGATLFGLWQARHAVRAKEQAILVEGNFDVLSLHARGIDNVVAPLGTAFTIDQAKLLRRYAVDVTLLFDGDGAGRKAALAAEEPCEKAGMDAKVAVLPDGCDPDEWVRTKGKAALDHIISQSRGLPEYLIEVELDASFNAADAREQAARATRVEAVLSRQTDPVFRGMLKAHADRVASRLDLVRSSPDAYGALIRRVMASVRAEQRHTGPRPSEARVAHRRPGQEERKAIVGALLDFPVLLDDSELARGLDVLEGESARIVSAIVQCVRITEDGKKVLDSTEFLAQMPAPVQAFARPRLAVPAHETIEEARTTVIANVKKLRGTNVALETRETVREQQRDAGDWEAGVERAKHVASLVEARHGLVRR